MWQAPGTGTRLEGQTTAGGWVGGEQGRGVQGSQERAGGTGGGLQIMVRNSDLFKFQRKATKKFQVWNKERGGAREEADARTSLMPQ